MFFVSHSLFVLIIALFAPVPGIDPDEARRKREDNIVQMRKDKRDESLQKKRMVSSASIPGGGELVPSGGSGGVQQKVRMSVAVTYHSLFVISR